MAQTEQNSFVFYTIPAQLNKAVNTLRGIVAGISSDGKISDSEISELVNWCQIHASFRSRHPFSEIIPTIEAAVSDGVINEDEKNDILWICSNFVDDSKYYDITTSTIQFLNGFAHGLLADGDLSSSEIRTLSKWIEANDFLRGTYPYDEICSILFCDSFDPNELLAFLSTIIDFNESFNLCDAKFERLRNQYLTCGIYSSNPEIVFSKKVFCFTGDSYKSSRSDMMELVKSLGGDCSDSVTKKVNYLVVGEAGSDAWAHCAYGRKIEKAMCLRKQGLSIQIVRETDFWSAKENYVLPF